ncbi:MAG: hypothetical protein ACXAEX_23820 [Promethearchaeota archaeon]
MNLTEKVKDLAISSEMDYVGIAPVDRLKNAPEGWRPNDHLIGCRSVVSMGVGIREGVRRANMSAYRGLRHGIYVYMVFGYARLNDMLNQAAFRIARLLEREGYISTPIPAARPYDAYMPRGAFSNRHAAVAAGLGEFGWNTLLVTPESGPRVRLVSVLTEAELMPNPLYSGEKLCNRDGCEVCVSVCPVKAISRNESVTLELGGKTFEYAKLNKWKCRYGVSGLVREALGRKGVKVPDDPQPEESLKAWNNMDPWQIKERATGSWCGRCIIECPIPRSR